MGYRPSAETVRRARAIADGVEPAAPLREASTVILLRDGADGMPEVFMLRRRKEMAFAGGMLVFPGGAVEARDASLPADLIGPGMATVTSAFDSDEGRARRQVVAAVRELVEETGVLLAGSSDRPRRIGSDVRHALETGDMSLADLLAGRGAMIDPAALTPWAHWVTPRLERRRFDTWFFAARVEGDYRPDADTGEADGFLWGTPADLLQRLAEDEVSMLPPTTHTLQTLRHGASVEALLASPPNFRRVAPGWIERDGHFVLITEVDPDYPGGDPLEGT